MRLFTLFTIIGVALLGFGCTDTQHYPVSGEECTDTDPVKDLAVQECTRPL